VIGQTAPNLLITLFSCRQAHEKWVTDVTEFALYGKKLNLSPVMDLYKVAEKKGMKIFCNMKIVRRSIK
jgi:hypothetical protein